MTSTEAPSVSPSRWISGPPLHALILGAVLATLSAAILDETARGQFDWFDMSVFLDAGYRTWLGQEPYVDFFYLAQPLHLWFHALFFELFGFNQAAVLAHLHAFNTAAILLMTLLAGRLLSRGPALLVSLLFVFSFYGPIAHPWYDQNAYFFILAGLVLLEMARTSGILRGAAAFGAGAAAAAAFMIKANVGLAGGGTLLVAAAFSAGLRDEARLDPVAVLKRGLLSMRGIGGGLAPFAAGWVIVVGACLLALESPREFIYQAFIAYDSRSRLANLEKLRNVLLVLPFTWILVPAALFTKSAGPAWRRGHAWDLLMLHMLALTGLATAFSGSMSLHAKITFVAPTLLYLFRLSADLPLERIARELVESLIGVTAIFLTVYAAYASMPPSAWSWRGSNRNDSYELQVESFRGWRCNPRTGIGVDRTVAWIRENVPRDESLFIFPDCTVIYGMTGRESFPGVSFIWHLNHLPPPGPIYDRVRARIHERPPRWVVLHMQDEVVFFDTNLMLDWMGLRSLFTERYDEVWSEGEFHILRLKQPGALATPSP